MTDNNSITRLIEKLIELQADSLNERDKILLRENVKKLEFEVVKIVENSGEEGKSDEEKEEFLRQFWYNLVRISLELQNIELSLYGIARLKLAQLALLIREILQQDQDNKINEIIAFSYISSYFQIETKENKLNAPEQLSLFLNYQQQDQLLDYYLDAGKWTNLQALIEHSTIFDDTTKKLRKQLIDFQLAQHLEIDEKLDESLVHYEKSGVSGFHLARVVMKLHMDSSPSRALEKYCLVNKLSMQNIWQDFQAALSVAENLKLSHLSEDDEDRLLPSSLLRFNLDRSGEEKWFNGKNIEILMTVGATLDSETRSSLNKLAFKYQKSCQFSKAASLYLCLNQIDTFINNLPYFLSQTNCLKVINSLPNQDYNVAISLINYFRSKPTIRCSRKSQSAKSKTIFESCLKLGLLDEVMCEFARDKSNAKDEKLIIKAVEYLENMLEEKELHTGCLDQIDPELKESTLLELQEALAGNEQVLSTNVINFVILSASIFLFKLDETDPDTASILIPKLEHTFRSLTNYLDELSFSASDALVRSVTHLICAAKEKLDALTDSDTIRVGLKHLVDSIASRCMIEGRYKSAAKLYSQIEDNVNAIKSLMRTGDTDVVINYSLLVRDVTVNRITMNYLKHLNVNPTVIDDFILKCKTN